MIAVICREHFLPKDEAELVFTQKLSQEAWKLYEHPEGVLQDKPDEVEIVFSAWPLRAEQVQGLKNLQWIFSYSAGVDRYPLEQIKAQGLQLTNTSGIHGPNISEQVVGAMIAFSRNFLEAQKNQRAKVFDTTIRVDELYGKRLLLVGVGGIGLELARKAKAFDMEVIGLRRTAQGLPSPNFDAAFSLEALDRELGLADYVVTSLPSTQETRGLFNGEKFSHMQKHSIFINVGRGDLVVEEDLYQALKNGVIKGAYLDVFQEEPLPQESPLWDLDQVIITPHNAGTTPFYMERAMGLFLDNLSRFRQGQPLRNQIDLSLGY